MRLPAHRTLFRVSAGCGLPIGNLTSQFGANVHLDSPDQFIKHELKARYYVRYCDDMVLLSADAAELAAWERAIGRFLDERLRLRLNDRRKLRPVSDGGALRSKTFGGHDGVPLPHVYYDRIL